MIALTRLNQEPIIINTDAIAYVESTPDTLITLTNGDRLHVKESVPVLIDLAIA
ncbi:MAG: flagellar protein, partial [Myxococcales bacterium]|nr:flagellar protein [Myxococcales bacterium]